MSRSHVCLYNAISEEMEEVLCGRKQLEDAYLRGETLASLVQLWAWELGEIPGHRPLGGGHGAPWGHAAPP